MAILHMTAASLRVLGDDLDPDEVTAALGKQPDVASRRGDRMPTRSGRERVVRRGRWSVEVNRRSPGNLDAQVAELLAGTTENLDVWRGITARYDAEIFCDLFLDEANQGLMISPATLRMLGERGISLDLDIYYAGPDEAPTD